MNKLPPDMEEADALLRRTGKVALLGALTVIFLWLISFLPSMFAGVQP